MLVTIAVLFATLASGGPEESVDTSSPPAQVVVDPYATTTTSPLQGFVEETAELPAGDYEQFCQVLDQAIDPAGGDMTPERFTEAISKIDFAALVAAAPEGFRPKVELLRDSSATLVELMGTVESLDDLTVADFPEGVPAAIIAMGQAYAQKCT